MKEANIVSESREKQLLGGVATSESVAESAKVYVQKLREESLEGFPDYLRILYIAGDYLGITSPEQRLAGKVKKSDQSCIKQRVMISHYEKQVMQQEKLIAEKESELRDCVVCYERRNRQIEETELKIESLEEERQDAEKNARAVTDSEAHSRISGINQSLLSASQDLRKYSRERNEFASRIIENRNLIGASQQTLVAVQTYASTLQKSYLRSRIERMRLAPMISIGKSPVETIDMVVADQRIAEETGRLADVMTEWVGELTEQMESVEIAPREREAVYSGLQRRHSSSSTTICEMADKIIAEQRRPKYT